MGTVNYEDERFAQVEDTKDAAITDVKNTYDSMINQTDQFYDEQIEASKQWAEEQSQLQQEQTDFAIEQIEQQKEQSEKDYITEQSGAYADWQKQSGQYGVNAEQMAASGLTNTGFSESSQVGMYNTYQNRVASARESFNQATLNYNNAIQQARLQNNSKLAEIAYNAYQQQLELALQGFQYKNTLLEAQMNELQETEDRYYQRYQDVLNQINTENAMAEEIRQYNESLALQKEQLAEEIRQFEQSYALQMQQYQESIRQFNEEMARLKEQDKAENAYRLKQLEMEREQMEREQRQFEQNYALQMQQFAAEQEQIEKENEMAEKEYKLKKAQLEEEQRQFDESLAEEKRQYNESAKAASSSSKTTTTNSSSSSKTYAVNTEYYQGDLNEDAKTYGTFSNGYQPKGISGYGKVSKSGQTIDVQTKTLSGQTKTVTQNVWKTPDGTLWYWEGRKNKYVKIET